MVWWKIMKVCFRLPVSRDETNQVFHGRLKETVSIIEWRIFVIEPDCPEKSRCLTPGLRNAHY